MRRPQSAQPHTIDNLRRDLGGTLHGMGFNPIEAFIQTYAAANPDASGDGLVDTQKRLIGMDLAIFTKETDANIGVNFAL